MLVEEEERREIKKEVSDLRKELKEIKDILIENLWIQLFHIEDEIELEKKFGKLFHQRAEKRMKDLLAQKIRISEEIMKISGKPLKKNLTYYMRSKKAKGEG